nr:hypothetical protein AEK19_MT0446, mitochondrial [Tanacetum cinerariifolium]
MLSLNSNSQERERVASVATNARQCKGKVHAIFSATSFISIDQLQNQLDKDDFQEDKSMAAFLVLNNQFQKFIDWHRPDHDISLMICPGRPNHDIEGWGEQEREKFLFFNQRPLLGMQVLRVLSLPTSRHHLAGSCRITVGRWLPKETPIQSAPGWEASTSSRSQREDLFSKKKGDSISSSKPFLEDAVRKFKRSGDMATTGLRSLQITWHMLRATMPARGNGFYALPAEINPETVLPIARPMLT